jgi:hypothetical protein
MKRSAPAIAISPKGMLMRKIQRHDASVTMAPPNSGPASRPNAGGTVNHTMADTICAGGTLRSKMSRPTGSIMAPPSPCSTRKTTSCGSVCAAPHRVEPSENKATATQNTRLAPKRSASQPLTGRNTARLSRYEVIARFSRSTLTSSASAMVGNAVAITEVSRFCRKRGEATMSGTMRWRGGMGRIVRELN